MAPLSLHYVKDYRRVVSDVYTGLRLHGTFFFSVEHPICTALCHGWHRGQGDNEDFWPVDNYWSEGLRKHHWFVDGVIKYHHTVETYLDTLLKAGFTIRRVLEPQVDKAFAEKRTDLRSLLRRPPLLVVRADKTHNGRNEKV